MYKFFRNICLATVAIAIATTSQAGLLSGLLPKPTTVIGAAAIYYAATHCKTVKDRETGKSNVVCKEPNISKSESSTKEDKPSLLDPKADEHILDGDATGGGHRSGTGKPGKSEFPADWSDEKIQGEISDIATDPSVEWSGPNRNGYLVGNGVRDGVEIQVVKDQKSGRIVTGYPTNLPRNP